MLTKITEFRNEYYFLSNFYPINILFNGFVFPSSEHAYQAFKAANRSDFEKKRLAKTPAIAKRLGRTVKMVKGFEGQKINLMKEILRVKFHIPEMKELLLATGEKELIESNTWNDTFWGMCNGKGYNHLGKLLMQVRMELS